MGRILNHEYPFTEKLAVKYNVPISVVTPEFLTCLEKEMELRGYAIDTVEDTRTANKHIIEERSRLLLKIIEDK